MTNTTHIIGSGTAADGSRARRRVQLVADGVVASYIHDISVRHPREELEELADAVDRRSPEDDL
jgi:hypothetical protein